MDFLFIATPWIHAIKFTSVYHKSPIITIFIILGYFSLYFILIFWVVLLIFFFLIMVYYDLIYSNTNHLQYHVIVICIFPLDWFFGKFNWGFLKDFILFLNNTYYSILAHYIPRLLANNR